MQTNIAKPFHELYSRPKLHTQCNFIKYSHPVAEAEVEVLGVEAMPSLSGDAADEPGVFVGVLNLNVAERNR